MSTAMTWGRGRSPREPREIPYQMQGVIGVPEGENCPVVIFLHGSHPVRSAAENRYDLGFSYLVDQLADAGVSGYLHERGHQLLL